jgi:hypothetical protein
VTFTREYSGRSSYLSDLQAGPHRLLVAVPCQIGSSTTTVYALLDTAAEWCVLPAAMIEELGEGVEQVALPVTLHTRLGLCSGHLARISLQFVAEAGVSPTIEATWAVCPDWTGPAVIGWKGCLERLCFALEPDDEAFYFDVS